MKRSLLLTGEAVLMTWILDSQIWLMWLSTFDIWLIRMALLTIRKLFQRQRVKNDFIFVFAKQRCTIRVGLNTPSSNQMLLLHSTCIKIFNSPVYKAYQNLRLNVAQMQFMHQWSMHQVSVICHIWIHMHTSCIWSFDGSLRMHVPSVWWNLILL